MSRPPGSSLSPSPSSGSGGMSQPSPSVSFLLDGCLLQLESELRQHVSLLVYRRLSLADFLSHSAFLSYSTLQGLLCFSSRHLSSIVRFLVRLRCQPLQLVSDVSLPPPFVAPLSGLTEPAKHILILRTILTLASHVNSSNAATQQPAADSGTGSAAAESVQLSLSRLLAAPSSGLSLSAELCTHLEHSALHFFVSPLPASPSLTRWTAFVHLLTGHDKKRRQHMKHAKGDVAGPADASAASSSDSTLSDHERLLLLSEETQQLWAALLGLLSLRCGRAANIVGLFLPHIACALPSGGKEAVERLMAGSSDQHSQQWTEQQQQQQQVGVLDVGALPSLPPIPLPSGSHPLSVLVALIRSLSLLHLSIAGRAELQLSHSVVSALSSLFSAKSTLNSTRRELAMCLSSLLSPLTLSSWSASVSYRQWFAVCQSLYSGTAEWIKRQPKAKNQSLAAPLLVATLSCCDPEAFIRHFTATIQSLLLAYHCYRRKRIAGGGAVAADASRLASVASIDSVQQLLHVYLLQRASRHETTIANLETIHSAFLLSRQHSSLLTTNDEDGYSWMKGSTQDGLVALILTTAKADKHFTAHEIILPMLESQERRRKEQSDAKAASSSSSLSSNKQQSVQQQVEGVSGQVVTGLRALAAILALDDEGTLLARSTAETEAAAGTNNKQPAPQLASTAQPTSLSAAVAALRSSLLSADKGSNGSSALSFYNPHAMGESASYLHRLAAIVGTILTQCDAVVGHVLLIDPSDDVTADEDEQRHDSSGRAAAEAEADSGDEDDEEADDRRLATTTAMRLVLRVMSVIWPSSLPVAHTLTILVKAAVHADKRTREASRRVLLDMGCMDEQAADKGVQRGAIVQCLVSRINLLPNAYGSSSSRHRMLSDLLLLLNQLLQAWLAHSTFNCQQLEGLILHEVEAAVGVWLAAVHPLLRLACIAVLLTLRALAHQLLGYKQHDGLHSPPQRQQQRLMSAIEARDASLQQLAGSPSPTRHFLVDSFTACSCSPTAVSLSLDSLLPNHRCTAETERELPSDDRSAALRSIAEQGGDEEEDDQQQQRSDVVDEDEDGVQRPLEQLRDALHRQQSQPEQQAMDRAPDSASSASPGLSSLSPAGAGPAPLSLAADEFGEADDGECYLAHATHSPRRQPLSSLVSHTSEWRWSLLLAHWMRAVVSTTATTSAVPSAAAGSLAPSTHLSSVLSTLFTLVESRLLPFHSIHATLCKRLKGRPPSSELSVLSAAGLPSSRLAVVKNLCLMAAAIHSASFAAASQSYIGQQLLPLLSSPFSVVRRIGSVSVGNVHQSLTAALLHLLEPLERSVASARDDVLRVHLSHVYRLLAESHTNTSTTGGGGGGGAASSFVARCQSWVVSTFQWLAITGNEFRWDLLELRRHFCVVVERLAATAPLAGSSRPQLDDSLRRQLFSLLLAWCGHGPSSLSYSSKVDKHASELLSKLRGTSAADKAKQLKASYANEVRSFRLAALGAMAALLSTDCFDEQLNAALLQQPQQLDSVGIVFPWLNSVLVSADSEVRDVAYRALELLILHNERLLPHCLAYCYHPHSMLARRYFLVIAQLMLSKCQQTDSSSGGHGPAAAGSSTGQLPFSLSLPGLLLLLLFKLGDPSYNVRSMSLRLLPVLESRYCPQLPSAPASSLSAVVGSHLADTYRQVQLSLSSRLAATFSPLSDQLTIEACRRVAALRSADSKQQLLNCLPPWLRNIRLTRPAPSLPAAQSSDDGYLMDEQWLIDSETWEGKTTEQRAAAKKADSDALRAARPGLFRHACYPTVASQQSILAALLELTHSMHASHATRTVELVWLALAAVKDNVAVVLHMLLLGLERRQTEPDFHADTMSTHKRVALFCSRASPIATVGKLVHTMYKGQDAPAATVDAGTADKRGRLSVSHFALLLLVEVAYEIDFSSFDQPAPLHRQSTLSSRASSSSAAASSTSSAIGGPSASCQATLDTLSVLLHIGVLGLHHSLQFIRHHSAILLINIVHNTAFNQQHHAARALFVPSRHSELTLDVDQQQQQQQQQADSSSGPQPARPRQPSIAARTSAYSTLTAAFSSSRSRLSSAPSAGLSLAIAESQQLRVLGVRQRRALLLMNKLNSHGRPHAQLAHTQRHQQQQLEAADVQLSEVVHTLLRVVADSSSRPSLSRRWWHHAVQWSVGSASALSTSQSHLVYRALSPPLLLSHYWKCVAALERHIVQWRSCGGSAGLVHLLLTLQQLVGCMELSRSDGVSLSQRHSTSASSALRCELLPCLLWSCVDVLHRAFGSPALRADSSLLVCCIRVIGACLSCARDDRHFEQAVYDWKRRKQQQQQCDDRAADDDEQLLFVGIQPLLMRCLLPADISVYSSFPTLNMLSTSAVQLAHPTAQQLDRQQQQSALAVQPAPPSAALVSAVFSFLASFTPLPSSPLAPLLDISSFAQRALASLVAQLPLILQHIDEAATKQAELVTAPHASSLPCSHQPPFVDVADSAEMVSSCQSLSRLFSSLGLLELALVFACASAGHFASSAAFVQSLSEPLLAVLPTSVVLDACLLWLDVMDRLGAFVPVASHFHPLSAPRQPQQYAQLQHCSAADCCAAAALCGGPPTLSHYILTMVTVVLAHCDWHACQLSAATAAPLFQRLQQLLCTSMAPLAAHALTVAMERADGGTAAAASHRASAAHQLAHALLQPAAQPPSRYEPNPSRLSTLRDSQQPVLVVRVLDEARRESGVLRVTDSGHQQSQQRPSAPPHEQCHEQQWTGEEERKVQFVNDANQYGAPPVQQQQQQYQHDRAGAGDGDVEDEDSAALDDSGDEAALSLSLPPQFHQLLSQPPMHARPIVEGPLPSKAAAGHPSFPAVLPPKPAASSSRASFVRPNVTTSVRRARGSSLHVDVKLSIPCLPTLNSGDGSAKQDGQSNSATMAVADRQPGPGSSNSSGSQSTAAAAAAAVTVAGNAAAAQSSEPVSHAVKSRPRPLIRKRAQPAAGPQHSSADSVAVLSELSLNTQQRPTDVPGAVVSAAASSTAAASGNGSCSSASSSNSQNEPWDEPSGGGPAAAAKPRRSQLMSAMMEQRDRKRREDVRRKEEETARLQQQQQPMPAAARLASHYQRQQQVPLSDTASSRPLIQRTLDGLSSLSAASPGQQAADVGRTAVIAAAAAAAGWDVSAALREDKRKRDAEGQRLRQRRLGIRDRMKEVGATARTATAGRSSNGAVHADDSGSRAIADAQRQSVLPCTFHPQLDEDTADTAPAPPQPLSLSLDDIMAGRVNYQ